MGRPSACLFGNRWRPADVNQDGFRQTSCTKIHQNILQSATVKWSRCDPGVDWLSCSLISLFPHWLTRWLMLVVKYYILWEVLCDWSGLIAGSFGTGLVSTWWGAQVYRGHGTGFSFWFYKIKNEDGDIFNLREGGCVVAVWHLLWDENEAKM